MIITTDEYVIITKRTFKIILAILNKFPFAYSLFFYLVINMDSNNSFTCSIRTMEEDLEYDTHELENAIELLIEINFIIVERGHAITDDSVYFVNPTMIF